MNHNWIQEYIQTVVYYTPVSVIFTESLSAEAATGRCSVKKVFFGRSPYCGHCLNCSGEKVYSHRRRFFFTHVILPEIRIGSFSHEFRCSGARNKFRAGVLSRIFSYSTEHLHSVHLLSYCGSLSVSSLRRKRTSQFSQEARTYYKRTRHYPRKK